MTHCSHCASTLSIEIPEGDHRPRHVCTNCCAIHYQNPKVIVGCLPIWEGKVLLCRRGIEPQKGFWNLPGGFMENGESVEVGAAREGFEETGVIMHVTKLHSLYSVIAANQVHLHFEAKLDNLNFVLCPESVEMALFSLDEIPWEEIAFSSNTFALKGYIDNVKNNQSPLHIGAHNHTNY
jgi:ADP-ribose pyrophosphatase YjhB (NUDIX family)